MKKLIKVAIKGAEANYRRDGEVSQVLLMIDRQSKMTMVSVVSLFQSSVTKDMAPKLLKHLLGEHQAVEYALVLESYMAPPVKDIAEYYQLLDKYGSISQMPNHRDAVIITYQNMLTRESECWISIIKGKKLGKFEKSDSASGKFYNLLDNPNDILI